MNKIAVIGAGVMGAGIAAHIANSGKNVLLFDIKIDITVNAINKLIDNKIISEEKVKLINPCDLTNDLNLLSDVDLVIEAIIENIDIKKKLYDKIIKYINEDCIISSNTSTITLIELTKNYNDNIRNRFLILHFFNPPRIMQLVEIVKPSSFRTDLYKKINDFIDIDLGKTIVMCNDTPGFIANRIGCYFLFTGISEASNFNISIDRIDQLISNYLFIPKTGIFGLFDLIGIDVIELIAKSLIGNLSENDDFINQYNKQDIIKKMIDNKMLGRKNNCGFYKIKNKEIKSKQILNIKNGEYEDIISNKSDFKNLIDFLESESEESKYIWSVISKTLLYSIDLIPEITDDIEAIDNAMKLGFGWKFGIFEFIDHLGNNKISGMEYLIKRLNKENKQIIKSIIQFDNFYKNNKKYSFKNNDYIGLNHDEELINLKEIKNINKPIYKNNSASIWDVGDDIICLSIDSKSGTLDNYIFEALNKATDDIVRNYKGLIIINDNKSFSYGADLKYILDLIESKNYEEMRNFLSFGQNTMLKLKNYNIIATVKGFAIGGGCELLIHSPSSQNHFELYAGLVETKLGLIPAWGGCYIMKNRAKNESDLVDIFNNILFAKISKSADEAFYMKLITKEYIMNEKRLLTDAKNNLLNHDHSNIDIKESSINNIREILNRNLDNQQYKLSDHDKLTAKSLIDIFTADDILSAEIDNFIELSKTKNVKDKIINIL